MSKAYVYILEDDTGLYYIGSTTDINRRLHQHQNGHTQTTRKMKNVRMVFHHECPDLPTARNIEKRLKKLKRKDYIKKIIDDGYLKIPAS